MKTKARLYLIIVTLTIVWGCGNKTPQNSKKAAKSDASIIENLSPEILLRQARAHFDLDQFEESQEKMNILLKEHPNAPEANNVTDFLVQLEDKMAAIKKNEEGKRTDSLYQERQKRLPNAVDKMRKTETNTGAHHFVDQSSPKFDTKECFYAYFTKDVDTPKLYFKIKYVASNWLDIENYIITVDQKDYTLKDTVEKRNAKGKKKLIQETIDTPIDNYEKMELLYAIANGQNVEAVYVGESSYKKRAITGQQRIAIRNVLDAYEFFGGKLYNAKNNTIPLP